MQTHLVLGHRAPTASGPDPIPLYVGVCADDAGKSVVDGLASGEFPAVEQCIVPRGIMRYADAEAIDSFLRRPKVKSALDLALEANVDFAEEVGKLHEAIAQLETDLLGVKMGRENMARLCTEANKEVEGLQGELARVTEEHVRYVESSGRVVTELQAELAKLKASSATVPGGALDAVAGDGGKPADEKPEKSGNAKGQKARQ